MISSKDVRRQFLEFFASKPRSHAIVPSSPVVPLDDPTLMFANAGMNQFKDVFLGTGRRPYTRAADTQKCIRAGGKHNDLDDVGQDTYHHTFFEMLGNWSFGDYFKAEAIQWAWELLTEVWKIDRNRLHATYFQGDPAEGLEPDVEARDLWLKMPGMTPERIHPGSKKDNFWEMGDTGPCGPCSEIHIDLTDDRSGGPLVNKGDARVIEIWNLVFIQYNRSADGKLSLLPAKHVDTGMGFERLCSVLQGKKSNYDTDVFAPIFAAIQKRTKAPDYKGTLPLANGAGLAQPGSAQVMVDVSYRVIADHIRTLTFALTDGAVPSNEGRGYVLRRILRRAVRYGRQYLNMHEPFLCDLVEPLVGHMSEAFPELRSAHNGKNAALIRDLIRGEENSFLRTLDKGIKLFGIFADSAVRIANADYATQKNRSDTPSPELLQDPRFIHIREVEKYKQAGPRVIPGSAAFLLHGTMGFPVDLTVLMAKERGLTVDTNEFDELMALERERARAAKSSSIQFNLAVTSELPATNDSPKYSPAGSEIKSKLVGYIRDGEFIKSGIVPEDLTIGLILDRTPFYAEQGGQIGDRGTIQFDAARFRSLGVEQPKFHVYETRRVGATTVHIGLVPTALVGGQVVNTVDDDVNCNVDSNFRNAVMQNHTSTHLLNWALREVLGSGIDQKGSLVDPEKTRFDFSHNKPVAPDELERIESLVNKKIAANLPVYTKEVAQAAARKISTLRAVFGEKYPDTVRVVSIGADIDAMLADPQNPKWMDYSVEFCGGTHLKSSAEADRFVLTSEEGVAKGIRRVVGLSGEAAKQAEEVGKSLTARATALSAQTPDLAEQLAALTRELTDAVIPLRVRHVLRDRFAELQKHARAAEKQQAAASGEQVAERVAALLAKAETIASITVVIGEVPTADADALRAGIDWVRNKTAASAVVLGMVEGEKVTLMAGISRDAVAKVKAGDIIKEIAPIVGGKGGGRPDMAQGGGTDTTKLPAALVAARQFVHQRLGA